MSLISFQRRTSTEKRPPKKRGGNFFEKLRIDRGKVYPILFVRGDYVDLDPSEEEKQEVGGGEVHKEYAKFRLHTRKVFQNGKERYLEEVCSTGYDPYSPKDCVGCFAVDAGDKTISEARTQYAWNVAVLDYFHGLPLLDDKGAVRTRQDKSTIYRYEICTKDDCNYCRTLQGRPLTDDREWQPCDPRSIRTVFGQRKYMTVGFGHMEQIREWSIRITGFCANDGDPLELLGLGCPNCQVIVVDKRMDSRKKDELLAVCDKPSVCPRCQQYALLQPAYSCARCAHQGRQYGRYDFYQTVFEVNKTGEGTKTMLNMIRPIPLGYIAQSVDPQYMEGRSFAEHLAVLTQPYDFGEMFAPRELAEQAKNLDLPIPRNTRQSSVYTRPGLAPSGPGQQQHGGGYTNYGSPPPNQVGAYNQPHPNQPQPLQTQLPQNYGQQQNYNQQPQTQAPQPNTQQTQGPQPYVPQGRPDFSNH